MYTIESMNSSHIKLSIIGFDSTNHDQATRVKRDQILTHLSLKTPSFAFVFLDTTPIY